MKRLATAVFSIVLTILLFAGCHSSAVDPTNQDNQNQDNQNSNPRPADETQRNMNEGGSIQIGNPPIAMLAAKNLTVTGQTVSAGQLPTDIPLAGELASDPNIAFAEFKVKWDPPDNAPEAYEVERKVGKLGEYRQVAKVVPPKTDTVEYSGLGATHYYRIKSINADGKFGYSEEKKLRVKPPCDYPGGFAMVYPARGCEVAAAQLQSLKDVFVFKNAVLVGKGKPGLVTFDPQTGRWAVADAFRNLDVNRMIQPVPEDKIYVATSAGIYRGKPDEGWEKVGGPASEYYKDVMVDGSDIYAVSPRNESEDRMLHFKDNMAFPPILPPQGANRIRQLVKVSQSTMAAVAGTAIAGVTYFDRPSTFDLGRTWGPPEQNLPKTSGDTKINYRLVSRDYRNLVQKEDKNGTVSYCLYRQTNGWQRVACDDKYRALAWIDETGKELYGNPDGGFEVTAAAVTPGGEIWAIGDEKYLFRFSE